MSKAMLEELVFTTVSFKSPTPIKVLRILYSNIYQPTRGVAKLYLKAILPCFEIIVYNLIILFKAFF